MSRQISHDLTYDATLPEVAAMLGDPAFRREVCEAQHVLSHDVTVEPTGGGPKQVRLDQEQSAASLPSFATKIVGERIRIVQEESWTSAERAAVTIAIPGKPGDITGEMSLEEVSGAGSPRTVQTVRLSVKVAIPFVGAKVEGLVGDMLLRALHKENEVGRAYLSRGASR